MVSLDGVALPDQTLLSSEHSSKQGVTDVAHTISGKPIVFNKSLLSHQATLTFNEELAWLNASQYAYLLALAKTTQVMTLSIRGSDKTVIFNHSATDGAVSLSPVMPFCDRYSGTVNLIILES